MAKEVIEGQVETGITNRIQPWQALFGVFTYALTQFDIGQPNTIILLGMVLACLGFVQVSTYKHKEAVKKVVAPWLVEQLLQIVSEYLKPNLPEPPENTPAEPVEPVEPVTEPTREEKIAELQKQLEDLGVV